MARLQLGSVFTVAFAASRLAPAFVQNCHSSGIGSDVSLRQSLQPPGLAQQLRIHPKLLRRVLRFLERDQILAREHRQEKAGRKRRAGDAAQEAGA